MMSKKAQIHEIPSDVYSPSLVDPHQYPNIEGFLKKKNPWGIWQNRWFYLNNNYLIYKKEKDSREVKGVLDLKETVSIAIVPNSSDILFTNKGDGIMLLRCDDSGIAKFWLDVLLKRMIWCAEETQRRSSSASMASRPSLPKKDTAAVKTGNMRGTAIKEGWVQKRNRQLGLQDRYITIETDHILR